MCFDNRYTDDLAGTVWKRHCKAVTEIKKGFSDVCRETVVFTDVKLNLTNI